MHKENKTQAHKGRSKNRLGNTKTIKDSFIQYNKETKKGSEFDIDYRTYRALCQDFNKAISKDILHHSKELKVPYRLGNIRIKKSKMNFSPDKRKYLKVDWKKTKETGIRVYHLNEHTDDFKFRWYWEKSKAIIKNKRSYYFEATRDNKRTLAKLLKSEDINIDYFE